MNTKDSIQYLQIRLITALSKRISWSLKDREAVSRLCIEYVAIYKMLAEVKEAVVMSREE